MKQTLNEPVHLHRHNLLIKGLRWGSSNEFYLVNLSVNFRNPKLTMLNDTTHPALKPFLWRNQDCVKCPCSEIFRISPYSARMREKKDQKNSKYGHFSRSAGLERSGDLKILKISVSVSHFTN